MTADVGDTLQVVAPGGGWTSVAVTSVSRVDAAGLYNPQTLHWYIVVDGVRASTFTVAVAPAVPSKLLAPLRAVYRSTGRSVGAFVRPARTRGESNVLGRGNG